MKILVANRSEIACRIARTIKIMGHSPVGIYEEGDSSHLKSFEEAYVCESYTNSKEIIRIAKDCNCQAIHPGYGFLSESEKICSTSRKS